MTTVQITLPDALTQKATAAGRLMPDEINAETDADRTKQRRAAGS